jgi:MATE family multidrug resistance protein
MCLGLVALTWRDVRAHFVRLRQPAVRERVFALAPLRRLLGLGLPIGMQFSLEMGVFALTALFIGWFGEAELGGHQVALQFAAMSFMVPLGLSMAAAVRVGWAVGRGDMASARRVVSVALAAGGAVMAAFMVLFSAVPARLAGLLTDMPEVVARAAVLLPIAAVFQVGDGLQVAAIGCLRGLGDTRTPMLVNVVGFWLVGLPTGCGLAFGLGLGPAGLWWGLCVGLCGVAMALLLMVWRGFGRGRARLHEE